MEKEILYQKHKQERLIVSYQPLKNLNYGCTPYISNQTPEFLSSTTATATDNNNNNNKTKTTEVLWNQ